MDATATEAEIKPDADATDRHGCQVQGSVSTRTVCATCLGAGGWLVAVVVSGKWTAHWTRCRFCAD